MNHLLRWHDENRMLPLLLAASLVLLVAIAAAALFSRSAVMPGEARVGSRLSLQSAYARVEPGLTSQPQLAQMGFDTARVRARNLSGLGVQEYFMPRNTREFDALDPAVRGCFETPDRCSALVFPLAAPVKSEGMFAANAAPREQGRIVFLLRSGRVAFKMMDGG
jgi:hypothetical protein